MKGPSWITRPSILPLGARIFLIVLLAALAGTTIFVEIDPAWLKWFVCLSSVVCLFVVSLGRVRKKDEPEEKDESEIMEIARSAIRTEATRLEAKRNNLEKILMAYGEWMEFPDFQKLQTIDWQDEAHVQMDERVAALLDNEADLMLQRFSAGNYWKDGNFEGRQLLLDLVSFTESIARVYCPESKYPLLELNLESLFKAVNRASLQIILLLEELPVLEVKEMNLRKVSDNIRKASKVYRKYEELQPYLKPVRYLWQGSKLLFAANPLFAVGWIAGSELIWKGGKHLGRKAVDTYVLSLLRQTLGIIAWETAGIYDATHRYRSPDWIYGVEIAHLLSRFDANQDVLRETFRELGKLPLRSTYDRIFLYRCIAQNVSPKPKHFAQPELLQMEVRQSIYEKLIEFYEKNISANSDSEIQNVTEWRESVKQRLSIA
ncbi:MAG: hypothetical protein CMO55_23520 [Verrucomicrobiales bacterium]|nr:hypothetical protein [Verrucomicrobiales bacterium]